MYGNREVNYQENRHAVHAYSVAVLTIIID